MNLSALKLISEGGKRHSLAENPGWDDSGAFKAQGTLA